MEMDWEKCLSDTQKHQSTAAAAEIASSTSWLKLWDMAMDYGPTVLFKEKRAALGGIRTHESLLSRHECSTN